MNTEEELAEARNRYYMCALGVMCTCPECVDSRNQRLHADIELFYDSMSYGARSRHE